MDAPQFDELAKVVGRARDRRTILRNLAVLGLAAVPPASSASTSATKGDNERNRKCKRRCERRCENRNNPSKCRQDCRERRCAHDN